SGRLVSPTLAEVQAEVRRAKELGIGDHIRFVVSGGGQGEPGSGEALRGFLPSVGAPKPLRPSRGRARERRTSFYVTARRHRQFRQLVDFTQGAVIGSEAVRTRFWEKADGSSVEKWKESSEPYRRYLWEEVLGKLPEPSEPLQVYTRTI